MVANEPMADEPTYLALPHNDEAEQALLGAMLVNNEVANRVSGFLRAEHFFQPIHGRIHEAIISFVDRGVRADPVTLKNYFENDEALTHIGGAQYLSRLAGSVVTIIKAEDYGRTIHDLFLRRQLIGLGEDIVSEAYDHEIETPADEQIEQAEQRLFSLADEGMTGGAVQIVEGADTAIASAEEAFKLGRVPGIQTGLVALDALIGGFEPSELYIIGGRPSMGKTALATSIADAIAKRGIAVAFFELEMSTRQIGMRLIAPRAGVSVWELKTGKVPTDKWADILKARHDLASLPIYIDDTAALTVAAIRARARRLIRRRNVKIVIIDNLSLVRPSRESLNQGRTQQFDEISGAVKAMAKTLNIPVIALHQLSRGVEGRDDKRPTLADLRQSGAIEQDADVVMFVYREAYYLRGREPRGEKGKDDWRVRVVASANRGDIIIAKQRDGPTGVATLHYDEKAIVFRDLHLGATDGEEFEL